MEPCDLFFNCLVSVPGSPGKPAAPDEIGALIGLQQGDREFLAVDPKSTEDPFTGLVDPITGWVLHVIPAGEKWGDQIVISEEMTIQEFSSKLLELPVGALFTATLVLPRYKKGYGWRRTEGGLGQIYCVVIDAEDGFSLVLS